MNYLAHGYRNVDSPYALAGSCLPDWLSHCDRGLRLGRVDLPDATSPGPLAGASATRQAEFRALVAGIDQHLADDAWFHSSPTFVEISVEVAARIRATEREGTRLRASFLGHVLTEMLLDAHLIETVPGVLDRFYDALGRVDPLRVEYWCGWITQRSCGRPSAGLARVVERFRRLEYLRDYPRDELLLGRLAQVTRRVDLGGLPADLAAILPAMRREVAAAAARLLPPSHLAGSNGR